MRGFPTYRVMDNNMKTVLTMLVRLCYAGGMKKLGLLALFALFAVFSLMAQDAEFYYERGIEYAESGDFDRAIEDFSRAITLDQNYVDAWYNRGNAYYDKGEYDRAIEDYSRAIALDQNWTYPWYNRGLAYYYKGEFDLAIEDYNRTITLDPNWAYPWNNRGIAYYNKGEFDLAIEDYSKAIELDQNHVRAWNGRGIAYYAKGELDRAIEDYTKAITIDQNWVYPWYNRGNAYNDKGEYDRAIEDYSIAITLDQNYANIWNSRGNAYYNKGEFDRAIEDYSRAIALDQNLVPAWNSRGDSYQAKGEFDRAIEDFSKAIELDQNYVHAWNGRGIAYKAKGELDRAIEDYSRAIALDENWAYPWNNRGLAYNDKGEFDRAIEDFSRAIALDENWTYPWYNRGLAYYDKGEFDRAIEDYSKAIVLDLNFANAWNGRGNAYYDKGELDLAIEDYNRAITLDPNWAYPWNNRGNAYREKVELDHAIEDFSRAIALDQNWAYPWNGRGNAYYDKGELDLAIEDYSRAIALDENWAYPWNNRGYAYDAKGEFDRAIEDYSRAIALDENWAYPWNNRGNAYKDKGEFNRAIEDFSRAITLDENWADPLNNRGNAYSAKGEHDLAIEDYNRAITLDSNLAYPWNGRGNAYRAKGELDQSIEDFSRAIAIDQNFAYAYNNRGNAYRARGELDLAIEDHSKSILLDPNNPYAWYYRGNAYRAKGELDRAIEDFKQSIETADKNNMITEIFHRSWEFAGQLYSTYPFLSSDINSITANLPYANLARESLRKSIARAEQARSSLGARGVQIMTGLLYQYYAGVDFEALLGSAEQAFIYSESLRSRGFLDQMGTEAALKLPGVQEIDAQNVRRLIRDIDNLRDLLSRLNPQTDGTRYAEAGIALSRAEAELMAQDTAIAGNVPGYSELRNPETKTLAEAISLCGDNRAILEYVIWDDSIEFKAPASFGGPSSFPNRPSINSYCLVITKEGITAVRLDPEFNYAGNVEALRSKLFIRDSRGRIVPGEESTFEAERNALYNALIRPVLEYIPENIENILIVPDSNLAFLPFDILRENNNPNTRSLGEYYSITLSPSVSVSILASQTEVTMREPVIAFGGAWYSPFAERNTPDYNPYVRDVNNNRLAAFSERLDEYYRGSAGEATLERASAVEHFGRRGWEYLAGTVAEVQGLERIATVAPTIIQGRDVSKRRVKELSDAGVLRNYPIIHFACHGYFNDNLTPQAALVFSEVSGLLGDDVDGYLSIEEIALLQLRARMVMMSACETGLGNLRRGDGMSGLARAFMVAGAQNVGVSLWEIDDAATVEFMWNVYRKVIREGRSFRNAYREVKEEFRRSARWNHPYYWAAFTMYE